MKKIIITNIVVLNGGDGAILFGMIKALKRAYGDDTKFVVFASQPEVAARMYPEIEFRETLGIVATRAPQKRYVGRVVRAIRSWTYVCASTLQRMGLGGVSWLLMPREAFRDLKTYAAADLIVSSGGTYLIEKYGLITQVCDYKITLALRRPLTFFTQSLGPFTHKNSQEMMRRIFNSARGVLLRDQRSLQNLQAIGVDDFRMLMAADAAFALADPEIVSGAKDRPLPSERPWRIAVSVRNNPHFKRKDPEKGMECYLQVMTSLTEWLVAEKGAEVTFLSTCQGIPEYDDDSQVACEIVKRLRPATAKNVSVLREFIRFDSLLQQLPSFDLVLATRMHMAILGLMAGTPVIPFVLEFKTSELFAKLGMERWVIDVERMSPESVVEHVRQFMAEIPHFRAELFRRVDLERLDSLQAGERLKELVDRTSAVGGS